MPHAALARTTAFGLAFVLAVLAAATLFGPLSGAQGSLPAPRITSPQLNQHLAPRVDIRWTGVGGARSYRVRVREVGQTALLVDRAITTAGFTWDATSARGGRFEVFVFACAQDNGGACGAFSTVSFAVLGPPVTLTAPADGTNSTNLNRRPTFSWQPYTGFRPSSLQGEVMYRLIFTGNGAGQQVFNTSSTSFTPPTAIDPAFQNPVRWTVQACTNGNCSSSTPPRTIMLAGSSFTTVQGPVVPRAPTNGAAVDTGARLEWNHLPNAGVYQVCLNTGERGCLAVYEVPAQGTGVQSFTLSSQVLDHREVGGAYRFRGRRMYWSVNACTAGFTSCTSQNSTATVRYVQVATAAAGGGAGAGGTPQVSFAEHLYPLMSSNQCRACHPTSNPVAFPQLPNNKTTCGTRTIPFDTSISAATMRARFLCLEASSTQGAYQSAYGKTYVVPGNQNASGLHHKAQSSSASVFGSNVTIAGVTKPLRDWIGIWIQQGANQ
jgi:hypothetical protein